MALQFSIPVRNAMLDSIPTIVGTGARIMFYTGAPPANTSASLDGIANIKICEFDLASTWMNLASIGSKSFSGMPMQVAAISGGILGCFQLYAADGITVHMQGTITATGGGGDITVDQTSVINGQLINITGFTLTAPGV